MKVSSLFDLITDGRDLLGFFEGVDTTDQLVSRLERLKRQGADEMLECVEGLRASVTSALGDTLEMSAVLDDDDEEDNSELDAELDKIANEEEDTEVEKPNPPDPPAEEKPKIDVLSDS
jgi:hypothetical protein